MPNFFDKYPYTDFHELNLDWVLKTVKEDSETAAQMVIDNQQFKEAMQEQYDDFLAAYKKTLGAYVTPTMFGDKSNDDTEIVKAAIQSGYNVLIDDDYQVSTYARDLIPADGITILFNGGSLTGINDNQPISCILNLNNVKDITIVNPTLYCDGLLNADTTEGAGHGIQIIDSSNIKIIGGIINNAFTDCVYIMRSQYVEIENCIFNKGLRMGLTITCGKNIYIRNCTALGPGTKSPNRGFGIEPNYDTDYIQNIRFTNCATLADAGSYYGAYVNINKFKSDNLVNITYENCIFDAAFFFGNCVPTGVIKGIISIDKCVFRQTQYSAIEVGNYGAADTPVINIMNSEFYAVNSAASGSAMYSSFLSRTYDDGVNTCGNINILNCSVLNSPNVIKQVYGNITNTMINNVNLVRLTNVAGIDYQGDYKDSVYTMANAEVLTLAYRHLNINNVSGVIRTNLPKGTKVSITFTGGGTVTFNGCKIYGFNQVGSNTPIITTVDAYVSLEWIDTNLAVITAISNRTDFT